MNDTILRACTSIFRELGHTLPYCMGPCQGLIANRELNMCENACRESIAATPAMYCGIEECACLTREARITEYFLPQSGLEVYRMAVLLLTLFALDVARQLFRAARHCKKYACRVPRVAVKDGDLNGNEHDAVNAPTSYASPRQEESKYDSIAEKRKFALTTIPKGLMQPSFAKKLISQGMFDSLNMSASRLLVPYAAPNTEWAFHLQVSWSLFISALIKMTIVVGIPMALAVHYVGLLYIHLITLHPPQTNLDVYLDRFAIGTVGYTVAKAETAASVWPLIATILTFTTFCWATFRGGLACYLRFVMNSVFQLVNAFVAAPMGCASACASYPRPRQITN